MQAYTVMRGDSLWRIASLFYQDGSRWPLIAEANRISETGRLTVGQRLVLPNGTIEPRAAPAPPPSVPHPAPNGPKDPLDRVAPILAKAARALIESCRAAGVEIRISQGLRTWSEQDALFASGRSAPGAIRTNARGGESFHNFGLAFDVVVVEQGRVTWDARHRGWSLAGEIGTSLGLLWGGNWKSIKDLPHFEMRGQLSLSGCRALYAGGLDAVWAKLG